MANQDKIGQRFEKRQEKQRRTEAVTSPDDPPLPDVPVEQARKDDSEVGRNDPCPCGSGKKYKKCCGKPT